MDPYAIQEESAMGLIDNMKKSPSIRPIRQVHIIMYLKKVVRRRLKWTVVTKNFNQMDAYTQDISRSKNTPNR